MAMNHVRHTPGPSLRDIEERLRNADADLFALISDHHPDCECHLCEAWWLLQNSLEKLQVHREVPGACYCQVLARSIAIVRRDEQEVGS